MTLDQFLSYLSAHEQTRGLAVSLGDALALRGVTGAPARAVEQRVPVAG
jgi:hypothetical protein